MNWNCHPERSEMKSEAIHSAQSRDLLFSLALKTEDSRPTTNDERRTTNNQRLNHVR